ncbi:MAG: hypothetical protein ACE5HO_05635 [bacterium]
MDGYLNNVDTEDPRMSHNDVRVWNSKLNLIENSRQLQLSIVESSAKPISFYEALAVQLAKGYTPFPQLNDQTFKFHHKAA